jgi:hypothetical protein
VKKTTGIKPEVSIHNKANQGTKTNGKPTRRNDKYANVSSSGYGRSSYKPQASKNNPSATSTLTDKTSKTSGTSSFISSTKSNSERDVIKGKKSRDPLQKRQHTKREGTLPKLPGVH